MNEEIKLTLEAANDCLLDARAMLESSRYKATVSRSYYAIFHAARAALLSKNIGAYTHQGVNMQFGKIFVKTGIFDKSLIRLFSKLLDIRQKADYEIGFNANAEDAANTLAEAESFVVRISDYLNQNQA